MSKTLISLIEIIVSVIIFAVIVVLTLQMFVHAGLLNKNNTDKTKAVCEVQIIAESIKSCADINEIEKYIDHIKYYDGGYMLKTEMTDKLEYDSGCLYKFKIDFYNTIDFKLLFSIDTGKFLCEKIKQP